MKIDNWKICHRPIWPFSIKTSSVGQEKVNKWEFSKLKITTWIIKSCHDESDSTHFSILRVSALYGCYSRIVDSFIFIHWWSRLFFQIKGYFVYMINKIKHGCLKTWNFSSRVQLYISLVRCPHSWAIELNTRKEIPHLCVLMNYSLDYTRF